MYAIADVKNNKALLSWIALLSFMTMIGVAGALRMLFGHAAHASSLDVPWGILISTYVFFVVSSTGLCLVSSLGHVFRMKQYEVIGKRAILLAMLTLAIGFLLIFLEVGHPIRFLYALVSPNLHSAIWWMGTLYGLYFTFIFFEFIFLMIEDHKKAQIAGLLGFVSAICAHSNLGAIFGFLEARPFWHGPYLPIYFILSALVSGSALIILMFAAVHRKSEMPKRVEDALKSVGKLLALFLGILMFFEVWKVITSLYGAPPEKYETVMALLAGPLSINFYIFEILLGMLIPFIIIVATNGTCMKWLTAAAASTMIGIFFMRYDLVIAGQLVPMRRSLDGSIVGNYPGGLAHYVPPLNELFIVVGAIGLCVLLYTFGEMLLNLNEKKGAH